MNTEERDRRRRKEAVLQAVQDKLTSPETPEVREHYERLRSLGHSDAESRELIATLLLFYLSHLVRKDDYGYSDYVAELARLPEIDWQEDEDDG